MLSLISRDCWKEALGDQLTLRMESHLMVTLRFPSHRLMSVFLGELGLISVVFICRLSLEP